MSGTSGGEGRFHVDVVMEMPVTHTSARVCVCMQACGWIDGLVKG